MSIKNLTLVHFRHFRHFSSLLTNDRTKKPFYAKQTQFAECSNEHKHYYNNGLCQYTPPQPLQKQTQFKPNSNPIQTQFKPNSKPIKPNFNPNTPKTKPIKPNFKPLPRSDSSFNIRYLWQSYGLRRQASPSGLTESYSIFPPCLVSLRRVSCVFFALVIFGLMPGRICLTYDESVLDDFYFIGAESLESGKLVSAQSGIDDNETVAVFFFKDSSVCSQIALDFAV